MLTSGVSRLVVVGRAGQWPSRRSPTETQERRRDEQDDEESSREKLWEGRRGRVVVQNPEVGPYRGKGGQMCGWPYTLCRYKLRERHRGNDEDAREENVVSRARMPPVLSLIWVVSPGFAILRGVWFVYLAPLRAA